LITLAGCASGGPPFDELPLRDTLRADPEAVAALPDESRARLAARFQAAGAADTAADPVEASAAPAALLAQVDLARQHRSADALVVGIVGGGAAQALPAGTQASAGAPLPPLEGPAATVTAELEARALAGPAGASLRELLTASHARRLQRVVGWPVAAVAIGDTAYVNGAWLVAFAPVAADGGTSDGGCDAGGCDGGAGGRAGQRSNSQEPPRVVIMTDFATTWPDAGTTTTPPTTIGGGSVDTASDAADSCAGLADACDSTDNGSVDSCDSTDDGTGDDSCSNTGDGSEADACSAPADDGSAGDCRTAPGRGRPRTGTLVWLFAPLAYLWGRKR
jgi:hypothetical protein